MLIRAMLLATALLVAACGKSSKKEQDGDKGGAGASGQAATPQSEAELDAPLAKIDDVVITVREFQDRINRQSPYIRARYTSREQKKEYLDSLIRFEVLAREAQSRGFDKDPDVVRTMKQMMIQKLMKEQFETKLTPDSITEAEMKKFFDEHQTEYNKPEEVRVSAIIVKSKKLGEQVAKDAQSDAGKTNKGFRELVTRHSTDEKTKIRGGDLRYFSTESTEVPRPVVQAAFALAQTGDVAGPIDAGNGSFYIVKQTGRRKAITKTYEQVKRQIQNRLYRDKRTSSQKEYIDALRKKAKIETIEGNLDKVRVDATAAVEGDPHGHGAVGVGEEGGGFGGHGEAEPSDNPGAPTGGNE